MIGNINIINKRVANNLQLKEEVVKKVNETYFKHFKNQLLHGNEINYYLKDIGTFSASLRGIRKEIYIHIKIIRSMIRKHAVGPKDWTSAIELEKKILKNLWIQYTKYREQMIKNRKKYAEITERRKHNKGLLVVDTEKREEAIQREI